MKKLEIVKSRKDCQWGYQIAEETILVICDLKGVCQLMWDQPFSIESGFIFKNEKEVDSFHKGRTLTLNILYANKIGKQTHNYDEHYILVGEVESLTNKRLKEICKEFKENGFNVTEQAVLTNFANWKIGYKCGYLDDANGYHLFTPCGANPFSLAATTLVDGADWQKTYLC